MSGFWIMAKNNRRAGIETNEDGVSLLEVMVALVLILLLVESLLPLLLTGMNGIGLAGERTAACTYADSLLEEMKVRPELLDGLDEQEWAGAEDLAFSVTSPAGMEACISMAPVEGAISLYQVRIKVLSTGGNRSWEENLLGFVPAPVDQD